MPLIPLRQQDGKTIAFAVVDLADHAELLKYRWHRSSNGYAARSIVYGSGARKTTAFMHREILGLTNGDGLQTDHINRNKLDNRRTNLRVATPSENQQNKTDTRSRSGVRGVQWQAPRKRCKSGWTARGAWMARLVVNGKLISRGPFDTVEEAAPVAAALREQYHPCTPR